MGTTRPPIVAVASYPGGGVLLVMGGDILLHKLPLRLHCDCVVGTSNGTFLRKYHPASHPITSRSAYTV